MLWKTFKLLFIIFIFTNNSFAGDLLSKGTCIDNDLYVFEIDKAKKLMTWVDFLEQENQRKTDIISQYKNLSENYIQQITNLEQTIYLYKENETMYIESQKLYLSKIQKLERKDKNNKIKNYVFLGTGIGIALGGLYIYNQVTD